MAYKAMIRTIQHHGDLYVRRLVASFLVTVVVKSDEPRLASEAAKRPRWVRDSGGRSRSTPVARARMAAVAPPASSTVRHRIRRPARTRNSTPKTGTRVR